MRRFRLGATSFVYPAGWLENVERLVGRVQDVELLFFAPEGPSGLPDARELRGLSELRARHGLSYSVHTPLSASLASEDEVRRVAGVREVLRVIDATRVLEPSAFVVHVYLGDEEGGVRPADIPGFRGRAARSLRALLAHGVASRELCVEYLDYDLDLIAEVIEQLDLRVALDIGHLLRDGRDWRGILERYLPRTRLIQWHGTEPGGRDHKSLEHVPHATAHEIVQYLLQVDYAGVLTLEVFEELAFERSLSLVRALLEEA